MGEKKEKMSPHEILIKKLVGAEKGEWVGNFYIPPTVLRGLGAQLLLIADLGKAEHRDDAITALKKVRKNPETSKIIEVCVGNAIKALEKEEDGEKKGKSKEE